MLSFVWPKLIGLRCVHTSKNKPNTHKTFTHTVKHTNNLPKKKKETHRNQPDRLISWAEIKQNYPLLVYGSLCHVTTIIYQQQQQCCR